MASRSVIKTLTNNAFGVKNINSNDRQLNFLIYGCLKSTQDSVANQIYLHMLPIDLLFKPEFNHAAANDLTIKT